ncbi:L,D-transpeptidase [Nibricoccus aquaticus]|uniref:L,D-transpeptidase n=1 Tax=Nibricoccus aquaticus TaxID=2576891 RepID=A0A290QB30_9BACT|nr:L,D-transpeptidase [Nibricoccus aquaticus]
MPTVSEVFTIDSPWESANKARASLGIKPAERLLFVSIAKQTMQFFRAGKLIRSFVISTSKKPPSNVKNSLGTPRGHHEIVERIGAGQPPGMVFKARVCTGHHFSELSAEADTGNLITSRILWLRGLETGVNRGGEVDTHDRYIYIHGTNRESTLGHPQSAGCVLMRNLEIVELYDDVRTGDHVLIVD